MEQWKIEGTNVLITGGASGLGAAYAELFLQHGAKNVAILDVAEKVGKAFTNKLNQTYKDRAVFVKCDVSKELDIENAYDQVLKSFKRIDTIINNAGIMNDSPDVWRTACLVNWHGLVSFTIKGIHHMSKDEGGRGGTIVNISSAAAFIKCPFLPIYCGSKSAVLHFGRSLSSPEFINNSGVRLLTICFGATDTALLSDISSRTFDNTASKQLQSRMTAFYEQSVSSAVAAFLKMYREGNPGTIWMSANNKEGKDITKNVDDAYNEIEKLFMPSGFSKFDELFENEGK